MTKPLDQLVNLDGPATSRREGMLRLLLLADFLETVPTEHFNMSYYFCNHCDSDSQNLAELRDRSCGTQGCAIGWAATDERFARMGIRLKPVITKTWSGLKIPTLEPHFSSCVKAFYLSLVEYRGLFADPWDSDESPYDKQNTDWEVDPKLVAKTLRNFALEELSA